MVRSPVFFHQRFQDSPAGTYMHEQQVSKQGAQTQHSGQTGFLNE